jgi:hypothetical protein
MARSKNPENYPPYYRDALLSVANTGRTLRVPTLEPHRLKQRLYAYINAVDAQENADRVEWSTRQAPKMRLVSLTHEPGFVILASKNHGTEADAFRAALEGIDPAAYTPLPQRTPEEEAALQAAMAEGEDEDHDEGLGDLRNLFTSKGDTE